MQSLRLLVLTAICLLVLCAVQAIAASCPYCGQNYGAAAPGDESRVYALRREHESTCPSRSYEQGTEASKSGYGVVTIFNRTSKPVTYRMQRHSGGRTERVTVQPEKSWFHYQPIPANFHIWFGGKSYKLDSNVVSGSNPTWRDGREYAFETTDSGVDLHTGSGTPRPELPGFSVSLVGEGTGEADGNFGAATTASGSYTIDYLTANGTQKRQGTWTAKKSSDESVPDAGYDVQVWKFLDDVSGSEATATIRGGAGTAEVWSTVIPDDPTASQITVSFGVQFSGNTVRLLTFTKGF